MLTIKNIEDFHIFLNYHTPGTCQEWYGEFQPGLLEFLLPLAKGTVWNKDGNAPFEERELEILALFEWNRKRCPKLWDTDGVGAAKALCRCFDYFSLLGEIGCYLEEVGASEEAENDDTLESLSLHTDTHIPRDVEMFYLSMTRNEEFLFTDPPYNCEKELVHNQYGVLRNTEEDHQSFFCDVEGTCVKAWKGFGFIIGQIEARNVLVNLDTGMWIHSSEWDSLEVITAKEARALLV